MVAGARFGITSFRFEGALRVQFARDQQNGCNGKADLHYPRRGFLRRLSTATAYTRQVWRCEDARALDLTDFELETAARVCLALAHQERQSVERIGDPALRVPVAQRAECAAQLAERFEKARKRGPNSPRPQSRDPFVAGEPSAKTD
jgi:hypothetical protein